MCIEPQNLALWAELKELEIRTERIRQCIPSRSLKSNTEKIKEWAKKGFESNRSYVGWLKGWWYTTKMTNGIHLSFKGSGSLGSRNSVQTGKCSGSSEYPWHCQILQVSSCFSQRTFEIKERLGFCYLLLDTELFLRGEPVHQCVCMSLCMHTLGQVLCCARNTEIKD